MGLQYTVHLEDEQGRAHVFGPGDVVPAWARAKITNPLAWDQSLSADENLTAVVHNRVELGDVLTTGTMPVVAAPPAQSGPGASRKVWADYAEANSVAVQAEWRRDDIIAACERAGVPV